MTNSLLDRPALSRTGTQSRQEERATRPVREGGIERRVTCMLLGRLARPSVQRSCVPPQFGIRASSHGSFCGGAIAGSESGEPNQDHRHHTAEEFAREVAAHLEEARQRHQFSHVILVAAPPFLGVLRNALSSPLSQLVERELAKDYTLLDGATIRTHISELSAIA